MPGRPRAQSGHLKRPHFPAPTARFDGRHVPWSGDQIAQASQIVGLLVCPLRARLFLLIDEQSNLSVDGLAGAVHERTVVVQQHLRMLKMTGLIKGERDKHYIMYCLTPLGRTIQEVFIHLLEELTGTASDGTCLSE